VRLLLVAMTMIGVGIWLSLWMGQSNSHLLMVWNGWRLEVSNLVVVVVLLISSYLLLMGLGDRLASRRRQLAQRSLGKGLVELAQGRWQRAEKKLLSRVDHSQNPLLNYLGAARAAQMEGDDQNRDRHLASALRLGSSADKPSKIAVGLLRAETFHQNGQLQQAVTVLQSLQKIQPRHRQVLKLLHQIYGELDDWQGLLLLLPQLRRSKLINKTDSQQLNKKCHLELLKVAQDIHTAWRHLPRKLSADGEIFGYYLRVLIKTGQDERAGKLLERKLKKRLDAALLDLFGQLNGGDFEARYQLIEKWLVKGSEQPGLLLAAARLASKTGQVDSAITYYEQAIEQQPSVQACQEIAQLLIQKKRDGLAIKWLQQGISLAIL